MGSAAVHDPHWPRPARLFAWSSFVLMAGGWLAFAIALVVSQASLAEAWTAVRDLPLPLEGLVWLLGFPFMAGLAIWQAGLDETVRLVAVAVLAVGYTYMFLPRERGS